MDVIKLIENYTKIQGIKRYSLKPFYFSFENWNDGIRLANNTVAFFHYFHVSGLIDKASDLSKNVARLETYSQNVEFSKVGIITDFGNIQQLTSNYTFWATDFVKVIQPENNKMFEKIYQGGIHYLLLTILPGSFEEHETKIENQKNIIVNN